MIEPGDAKRLASLIANGLIVTRLSLDSNGGDLVEAMRIGEIVRTLQISTIVKKGNNCASSCFFIFLAGAGRVALGGEFRGNPKSPAGYVGLHRPYLKSPSGSNQSLERQAIVMKKVKAYLEAYMVPSRLIDLMMSRPSNDIYWMTTEDLEELGDYPPELEELYISKCNYDRKLVDQLTSAKRQGDAAQFNFLQDKNREVATCIGKLQFSAELEALPKLKKGWVPPAPF